MKSIFTPKVFISLSICAILVLSLAVLLPVTQEPKQTEKASAANEEVQEETNVSQGESVSGLFKVSGTPIPIDVKNLPTGITKEEACRLNGNIVKEGTVASNTICVNEIPTPTETPLPTPTP